MNTAFGELYGYDNLNQLIAFDRGTLNGTHTGITGTPSRTQDWTTDAAGNFTGVDTNGTNQSRTHNRQNQITALGGVTPTYDHNGNQKYDGTFTIAYDAWNRLVSANNGTLVYTYTYDALGRRIVEHSEQSFAFVPAINTRHFYYNNAWQVIVEAKEGISSTFTQVLLAWDPTGSDRLIYRDRDSTGDGTFEQRLYVQQDAQGNVTALIDTTGAAVERYVQDPYGVVTVLTGSFGARGVTSYEWKYYHQGLRLDMTGAFYDNRWRFYSATLMRFVQNDPIGFAAGDQNLYRYVGNGPVGRMDPAGLRRDEGITMLPEFEAWRRLEEAKCEQMKGLGSWPAEEFSRIGPWRFTRARFVKSCVGLCMDRLGTGGQFPNLVKGTRCFRTKEAAEAYKRELDKSTPGSILFAVQSERGGARNIDGSSTEIDPTSIDLTGDYNFATQLIGPDGVAFWEWMNTNLLDSQKPAKVTHARDLPSIGHDYFCVSPPKSRVARAPAK